MPGVCCDEESLEEGHPVLLPLCKVQHCHGAHQHVVCSFQLQGEGRGGEGRGGEGRGGEGRGGEGRGGEGRGGEGRDISCAYTHKLTTHTHTHH